MNKKIIIAILGIFFLVIIAGELAVYKYFSQSAKTEIKLDVQTSAEENNLAVKENADAEEKRAADSPKEDDNPEKTVEEKKENQNPDSKTEERDSGKIINKLVNFGYKKSSGRKIDTVIIHSTYNALGGDPFSLEKILDIYQSYGVSPHYIIDRSGKIYRLVADENIAYHAGESKAPDGRAGVNNFSIGIELINSKTEKPTASQYAALSSLINNLKSKYKIKYILGHSDIAPGRKDDPWNFNWNKI